MTGFEFTYEYARPSLATDIVVMHTEQHRRGLTKVLLIERGIEPFKGMWALPGGFVNADETAEQAAVRELREETGINVPVPRLFLSGVYSKPGRDPRGWTVAAAYLLRLGDAEGRAGDIEAGDDAASAQWFYFADLPDLAFDHADIIADARAVVRR